MNIDGSLFKITLVYLMVQGMLELTRMCFFFFIDALVKDKPYILIFHKEDDHVACLLYGPLSLLSVKMLSGVAVFFFFCSSRAAV